jgi:hypothetical protein
MSTTLAFEAHAEVPTGQIKELGTVEVENFSKIRVIAYEHKDSPTAVNIQLTITEPGHLVAPLDIIPLEAQSNATRVYDVPGRMLTILAMAEEGERGAENGVGVLIYGIA